MTNNNVWANRVSEAMIHEQKTTDANGVERTFYNVSVPCPESKTGFASFAVNAGQVRVCTNRNGDVVEGRKNILLGAPDKTRKVSLCTKLATKKRAAQYTQVEMTNQQIADLYAADYKAYKARQKATETETAAE